MDRHLIQRCQEYSICGADSIIGSLLSISPNDRQENPIIHRIVNTTIPESSGAVQFLLPLVSTRCLPVDIDGPIMLEWGFGRGKHCGSIRPFSVSSSGLREKQCITTNAQSVGLLLKFLHSILFQLCSVFTFATT